MFSGIIEEVGRVRSRGYRDEFLRIEIAAPVITQDIKPGDSVAVNGVCLTAEDIGRASFYASLSRQTLRETSLSEAKTGDYVNLERALKAGDRIGGHFVSGHIDTSARLISINRQGDSVLLSFKVPSEYSRYVVERGSIAVDGISLTVAGLIDGNVRIYLVPFTLNRTSLRYKKAGDMVNIEFDMLGKYVEKNIGRSVSHKDLFDGI